MGISLQLAAGDWCGGYRREATDRPFRFIFELPLFFAKNMSQVSKNSWATVCKPKAVPETAKARANWCLNPLL